MAVAWADFTQATITEAKYYDALKAALAERCAAACAGTGYCVFFPDEDQWCDATPDLTRLALLRQALRDLAPKFVRLEDERYAWQAWSRFPIAYAAADLMKGEHSLAILPAPGTPEANGALLEVYRTFLGNCAWWLRRFRYVDVSRQSFYTRRSTARGSIDVEDYHINGKPRHSESGAEPETFMADPVHESTGTRRPPDATGETIRCAHSDNDHYGDHFDQAEGVWRYDYSRTQYRSVSATAYSGLVVRNGSGLEGRLLLVPCYSQSSRGTHPTWRVDNDFIDSVMPTSGFDDGDRMAETVTYVQTDREKHGGDWLETYGSVFRGRQWYERIGEHSTAIRHEGTYERTSTTWSLDGSRSHAETETEESTDWYNYTILERTELSIHDFDGFGQWSLGEPVEKGAVPAHGRAVAIPEADSIPLPDEWNLAPYRQWRRELHPRDRDDNVSHTAVLRIAPVLDFNPSYQYQDT